MKKPFYAHLYVQVLAGIVLGAAIGLIWPQIGAQPWICLLYTSPSPRDS